MRVTLPATYRLPSGKAMSNMVAKLFALQKREVLAYVRSGRTSPINLNGWIDYTAEKLLPYYLWHVMEGWKVTRQRMDAATQDAKLHLGSRKSIWSGLMKSRADEEKDDKKKWALLWLLAVMGDDVVADVKSMVRKVVTGILATSAKWTNNILAKLREIAATGGQRPLQSEIDAIITDIFTKPSRIKLIGEDEAIRAYHYGMVRVLQASKYRWMKTWWTRDDEKVCEVCGPLHGITIPMDQTFTSNPTNGRYTGILTLVNAPLAHPACRCKLEVFMDVDPAQYAMQPQQELAGV